MRLSVALALVALLVQQPTLSPLCVGALHAQQVEQRPGNPGHQPPPEDYYCESRGDAPDDYHACDCHRIDTDPLCEGVPSEDTGKCKVSCFRNHCHCRVHCEPGGTTE